MDAVADPAEAADQATPAGEAEGAARPALRLPGDLIGVWSGGVRPTKQGTLRFEFVLTSDGRLEVTGTPVDDPNAEPFRRSGSYRIDGGNLLSEAINEGQPVALRVDGSELVLRFDESLTFRLRRLKRD